MKSTFVFYREQARIRPVRTDADNGHTASGSVGPFSPKTQPDLEICSEKKIEEEPMCNAERSQALSKI